MLLEIQPIEAESQNKDPSGRKDCLTDHNKDSMMAKGIETTRKRSY